MDNVKLRAEFEAWHSQMVASIENMARPNSISPMRFLKEEHWFAWEASRAALVVELPAMPKAQRTDEEATYSAGGCDMLSKCAKAIEAAGVTVKS